MSKFAYTPITDEQLEVIKRESEARRAREPFAESVSYDAQTDTIKVFLCGGSVVCARGHNLRGLDKATETQLANVRIHDGRVLFWDDLDVQHSLIAFLGDALGIQTIQQVTHRGSSARTEAKAASARENGKKGGRPRKNKELVAA